MKTLVTVVNTTSTYPDYNQEAEQVLLRALDGAGGTWERHAPLTNLADLISGAANDNQQKGD